jgi:tryptophan-rich sensory protein
MNRSLVMALVICVSAAALEGICAGTGIRDSFRRLKWPSYSLPLGLWYAIGAAYYAALFICLYRVLQQPATLPFRTAALILLISIGLLNAVWNVLFFRKKNLGAAFVFSLCYSFVVTAGYYYLSRLDRVAAILIGAYGVYLVYANIWGYRVWRLNRDSR